MLYHSTTYKKAKLYRLSGSIHAPVRGFTTLQAAMAWSLKVGRKIIYQIDCSGFSGCIYKLPDHHNQFGKAWWIDANVPVDRIKCVFSADVDA